MWHFTPTWEFGEETPVFDLIPLLSQIKALVQTIFGDHDGANITQVNFLNHGIGAAQARSIYHLVTCNANRAWTIQKEFLLKLEPVVDGIPVVGHLKGLAHLCMGDTEHGLEAIKAATCNTFAAVFAIVYGGASALVGRLISDILISVIESIIVLDLKLYGVLYYFWNIRHWRVGEHFDVAVNVALIILVGVQLYNVKYRWLELGYEPLQSSRVNIEPSSLVSASDNHYQSNLSVFDSEDDRPRSPVLVLDSDQSRLSTSVPGSDKLSHLAQNVPTLEPSRLTVNSLPRCGKPSDYMLSDNLARNKFAANESNHLAQIHRAKITKIKRQKIDFQNKELFNYCFDKYLATLDLNIMIQKLTNLNVEVKTLITIDDFRTINPSLKYNNMASTLAGLLKMDMDKMKTLINGNHMYDSVIGRNPDYFLKKCAESEHFDYITSPTLNNIYEVKNYLMRFKDDVTLKQLILSQFPELLENTHSVALKYSFVDKRVITLLVDYQLPGLLEKNIPNPDRFESEIDSNLFLTFKIHQIWLKTSDDENNIFHNKRP